jgi:hypothetical protein
MTDYREIYTLTKNATESGREVSNVEIKFEAIMLDDLIEQFEMFLKASGFHFKGHLQIVSEDEDM